MHMAFEKERTPPFISGKSRNDIENGLLVSED
jgi:hypothetical protein